MLIPWSGLFTELDNTESFATCISACHMNAPLKLDFAEVHIYIYNISIVTFVQNRVSAGGKSDIFCMYNSPSMK